MASEHPGDPIREALQKILAAWNVGEVEWFKQCYDVMAVAESALAQQPAGWEVDADRVRRLAEDWADECVRAGYVTTVQCPAYGVMTQAINALAALAPTMSQVMLNGLTEAETSASASVAGLSTPPTQQPATSGEREAFEAWCRREGGDFVPEVGLEPVYRLSTAAQEGERTESLGVSAPSSPPGSPFQQPAAASTAIPDAWPTGLLERVRAAEQRIRDNHAPRRIPADPTDVDLVLAEVRAFIEGREPPFWLARINGAPASSARDQARSATTEGRGPEDAEPGPREGTRPEDPGADVEKLREALRDAIRDSGELHWVEGEAASIVTVGAAFEAIDRVLSSTQPKEGA